MKAKRCIKQKDLKEIKKVKELIAKNKASEEQSKKIESLFDKILAYQTTGKLPRFD